MMCAACLLYLPLVLCLCLKQDGRYGASMFSEPSECERLLVRLSKGRGAVNTQLTLLPNRFQDCRKLSEGVQNAVLAAATVYYWLPKSQGEIMIARQSPLFRMMGLSPLYKETQDFRA